MARKGWDALSAGYRRRLERKGVTRESYDSGQSLNAARGHKSASYEAAQSRRYRFEQNWVAHYSEVYGFEEEEIRAELAEHDPIETDAMMRRQRRMEKLYHEGRLSEAHDLWEHRDRSFPDWMNYYHGYFS